MEETPEQRKYRELKQRDEARRLLYYKDLERRATNKYSFDPLSPNFYGLTHSIDKMTHINTPEANQGQDLIMASTR
jgi:hypothetical protein